MLSNLGECRIGIECLRDEMSREIGRFVRVLETSTSYIGLLALISFLSCSIPVIESPI